MDEEKKILFEKYNLEEKINKNKENRYYNEWDSVVDDTIEEYNKLYQDYLNSLFTDVDAIKNIDKDLKDIVHLTQLEYEKSFELQAKIIETIKEMQDLKRTKNKKLLERQEKLKGLQEDVRVFNDKIKNINESETMKKLGYSFDNFETVFNYYEQQSKDQDKIVERYDNIDDFKHKSMVLKILHKPIEQYNYSRLI